MLILNCTKEDYWGTAFVIPVLSIAFLLILVLIDLWNLIRSYRHSDSLRKPVLQTIFCLMTLAFLFYAHFPTLRHGVFLPVVTEKEVQYKQGYVTSIADVPFSPRYSISGGEETYRASLVLINGEEFYFLSAEGLEIGKEIVISFLPKCDMVLTCQVVRE